MLRQKFYNVSREELEKIQETTLFHGLCQNIIENTACILHERRRNEEINGRESIIVGPIVHVISAHFFPDKKDYEEPITIYGRIHYEFCQSTSGKMIVNDLYSRKRDNVEVLGPSGSLSLTSLDYSSFPLISMPFHNSRLVVDICVGGKNVGAKYIWCAEDTTDFEQVKVEYVRTELGVLALRYLAMPFAVYAHVEIEFFNRQGCELDEKKHSYLDVKGKIVARYGNSYMRYDPVECTLFDKHANEFERVGFELNTRSMRLSRCWLGLPFYSSIHLDLDLMEFGSERKIIKETVELRAEKQSQSDVAFIVDDILINICVRSTSPVPQGRHDEKEDEVFLISLSHYSCPPLLASTFFSCFLFLICLLLILLLELTLIPFCFKSSDEEMSLQGTSKDDSDNEQMNEVFFSHTIVTFCPLIFPILFLCMDLILIPPFACSLVILKHHQTSGTPGM